MDRRTFLKQSGLMAASASSFFRGAPDRILVTLQLQGGNDAFNTVIPVNDLAAYRKYRPNISISRSDAVRVDKDVYLHPALKSLAEIYESGDLAIVQGVGYPKPSNSHLRSSLVWNSGELKHGQCGVWVAIPFIVASTLQWSARNCGWLFKSAGSVAWLG